jgi:ankyrin repeat protein
LITILDCDVNVQENNDDTPLHNAIRNFNANWGGDITVLNYLLSQKAVNVNTKGQYGYTLLHMACDKIDKLPLDIFKYLIETIGFDVNTPNIFNDTPLHKAFSQFKPSNRGDINVLYYLLNQKGIIVNAKGCRDHTLLHYACTNNLPSYKRSVELDAECDTVSSQIVEVIIERCVEQVLDELTL